MHEPVVMDDWDMDEPAPPPPRLFWPPWSWPLLAWLPLDAWHARFVRDLPALDADTLARVHLTQAALAWLATAIVLLLALAEAGFYGMLWAARRRRLPLAAATVAILQCGVAELLALSLLDRADGAARGAIAALAGARAFVPHGAAANAMMVAFGGAGLLALARCALFAGFQSRLVPCRWREAFTITCGAWLASHLAQGWLLELLAGRSVFR